MYVDSFTADGSCTEFTLVNTPSSENLTLVSISGLLQSKNNYSLSGNVVTFISAPPANSEIEVNTFAGGGGGGESGEAGSYANSAYIAANSASVYANAAFNAANNATDSWVRDAANSASSYANSGYSQSNTATTNAATADQRAVTSGDYANSAFASSNTADQRAVTSGSYANSAYGQANTATTNAATADQRAVTSGSYANSAYGQANTATTNAATADQKATSAGDYANSAFVRANNSLNVSSGGTITGDVSISGNLSVTGCTSTFTVSSLRTSDHIVDVGFGTTGTPTQNAGIRVLRGDSNPVQIRWIESSGTWDYTSDGTNYIVFGAASNGVYANSAFVTANAASSYANGGFSAANTADQKAVSAGAYANAAFAVANTGGGATTDSWARSAANSASLYANAAFTAANTGGGGGGGVGQYATTMKVDSFTGTGACTQFTLTQEPSGEDYTIVSINGILQHKDAYSLAGSQITFSEAPENGVAIDIVSLVNKVVGGTAEIFVDNFTGNGTNTSFTLSTTPASENYVTVVFDGVTQLRSTYEVNGTTITFDEAPPNTANIEVTIQKNVVGTFINRNYLGNGSNTNFTVTDGVSSNSVLVFQNGIAQRPIEDYTVSGNTLTFLTAPTNGEVVQIRELTGDPGSRVHAEAAFAKANTAATTGKSIAMAIVFGG